MIKFVLEHRYKKHNCHFKDTYGYKSGEISSGRDITHYDLFATSWMIGNQGGPDGQPPSGAGNNFHLDFDIFNSFGDVLRKNGEWTKCNANHASACVGFPRDCGESNLVGGRWFRRYKSSMDNNCGGSASGNFGHATFQILKTEWCPVSCTWCSSVELENIFL
jgi:hypothetical protein